MSVYEFEGHRPQFPQSDPYYVAPTAALIGKVRLRRLSSVWFGAVVRGDNELIDIGEESNIQDNCVLHTDPGFPLTLGRGVTVGHLAMLHGCTVHDNSLIGMGATVMNGSIIGRNCIVGAHALIGEGKTIEDNSMVLGAPGRVVKSLDAKAETALQAGAQTYVDKVHRYARDNGLKLVES
ncbi:gamma carbonic anhydrase family protein [Anderseniella sp. Alg231-50]|uniref:gamma carbonic anhydrase family protein n=1 Tax=Anderseniella sp. Alg231-50 TaxID=1922226 RepID=UPI000D5626A9